MRNGRTCINTRKRERPNKQTNTQADKQLKFSLALALMPNKEFKWRAHIYTQYPLTYMGVLSHPTLILAVHFLFLSHHFAKSKVFDFSEANTYVSIYWQPNAPKIHSISINLRRRKWSWTAEWNDLNIWSCLFRAFTIHTIPRYDIICTMILYFCACARACVHVRLCIRMCSIEARHRKIIRIY